MSKKGKRTAPVQHTEQIADLQRENEALKARLAEYEKGGETLHPGGLPSAAFAGSAVDSFTICDSELTVIDIDEAALRYLCPGNRKADVIGMDLADLIGDSERYDLCVNVVETGERFVAEDSLVLPDAGEVHVIMRGFRVGDGLGILISDITARKQIENEAKRSQELLRAFMDSSTDAFTVYDSRLTLTDLNDRALRYLGPELRREDVIGKNVGDFVTDWKVIGHLIKVMETGEPFWGEDTITLPAAGEITILTRAFRVGDGLGVVTADITARKKAEEGLRASEERSRLLLENANEGIAVVQDGVLKFANPKLAKVSGYSVAELTSKPFAELLHPDDLPMVAEYYTRRIKGEEFPHVYRSKVLDKAGNTMWAEINAVLTDWEGKPAVLAMLNDITERVAAQQALEESEQKYRLLVEGSADMIFSMDTQGIFTYLSPAVERLSGYRSEEVIGKSFVDFIVLEDLPDFRERLDRTLAGASESVEFRVISKDGSTHWVRATIRAALLDGYVVGVSGVMSDITERRQAEEKLRASEEKCRMVVNNANEAIGVVQDGVWKFANPKLTEVTGYTAEELLVKPFFELVHPDDRQMAADRQTKRMRGEQVPSKYQMKFLNKAGDTGWTEMSVTLIEWEGRPATLALMSDITERKLAEGMLRASEEKFRQITENMLDAVSVIDRKGIVTYASPSNKRLLGYTSEELVGRQTYDLIHPEDIADVSASFSGVLEKGETRFEYRFRHADGHYVWGEASARILLDDGGNVTGTVVASRDITRRKLAEESLRDSERRLTDIIEFLPDPTLVIDLDGKVIAWNRAIEEMTNVPKKDMLGKGDYAYAVPFYGQPRPILIDLVFASEEEIKQKYDFVEKKGNNLWVEGWVPNTWVGKGAYLSGTAAPLFDSHGNIIGAVESLRDITARKAAEEALRASEGKYRLLMERTKDLIWTVDLNLCTTYMSPSVEQALGFTPEELVGLEVAIQITPESFARARQLFLEQVETENQPAADPQRTLKIELEYYRKDGSTLWMEALVGAIRDERGTLIGVHGVSRDITKRKRAEEKLQREEQRFRAIAENSSDVIVLVNRDGTIVYESPAAQRVSGYSDGEFVGSNVFDLIHLEDAPLIMSELQELLRNPEAGVRMAEARLQHKDGSWRIVEISARGILRGSSVEGVVANLHDVTERKRAAQAVEESERRYRLLAENATDVIWVTDANLRITYASPSSVRILGYSVEEITSRSMDAFLEPGSLAHVTQVFKDDMISEESKPGSMKARTVEINVVCKDGSTVWLEAAINVIRDEEGRFAGFQGACRDIEARRQAEEKLRQEEQRFRAIAENSSDIIVMLDCDGKVLYESPAIRQVLGYNAEERIGASVFSLVHPEDVQLVSSTFQEAMRNPEAGPQRAEIRLRHMDGSWRIIEASGGSVVRGPTVEAVVVNLHDVTQRRKAEQALKERLKELRCIVGISRLAERPEVPVEDFVREAVSLLPAAWRYPDVCCARIALGSKAFATANFRETEWCQSADIRVDEKRFGNVTICYLKEMPEADEGPFSREERDLINTVADFLGHVIQHRQMEEALRVSEGLYRLLAENATDVIWTMDMKVHYTYVSPSSIRLTGYSAAETMAQSFEEILAPGSRDAIGRIMLEELATEERGVGDPSRSRIVEAELNRKDGSTVWVEVQASFLRDANGKAVGILGVSRDISERKQAEEELQRRERYFRALTEHSSDVVVVIDKNGSASYVSPNIQSVLGVTPEKAMRDAFAYNVHPDDLQGVVSDWAHYQEHSEGMRRREVRVQHTDGSWRHIEATGFSLLEDPVVQGVVINMRDVTERRRAEQALRASEEKFRTIFERSPIGAIVYDSAGVALDTNKASLNIFGLPRERIVGGQRLFDSPFMPDKAQRRLRAGKMAIGEVPVEIDRGGQGSSSVGKTETVYLRAMVTPLGINKEGSPGGYLALVEDITERKRMEEIIQRQRDLAHELSSVSDLQQGLRICLEAAMSAAGMDCGGVYLVDKASGDQRLVCHAGMSARFVEAVSCLEIDSSNDWITLVRSPFYDQRGSLGGVLDKAREMEGLRAQAVIPFFHEGKLLGFLNLGSHTADEVPVSVRGLLETICIEIGGAVARLQAQEALRASEERYRLVAENATDVIWTTDMDLRFTYVSPSTARLTGYSAEETMVRSLAEIMTPASLCIVSSVVSEELAAEAEAGRDIRRSRMLEAEVKCKDGSNMWVEIQATFLRDATGKAVGIVGVSRDITERRLSQEKLQKAHAGLEARVEQRTAELKEANMLLLQEIRQRRQAQGKLQESESRYRELVESANSVILELDTKGRITFFNRFAQEFFGFPESEIVGRHVVGTIAPDIDSDGKDRKAQTRDLIKHPESYLVIENEAVRRNGERVWISWTNKGLYDAKGRLRNVLCIGMDRTEQKRVAEMLAEQMKEKAAADERQRLARDLHDAVTQTLFSASLIAEVLPSLWKKDREEGERRLEELRRLTRGALAEMRMLLLELRPGALGEVGLAELLSQLAEATAGQSRLKVPFVLRGQCNVPIEVQVAFYRVAQEALNNVVKHSGATEAEIRLLCHESSANLTISDNGSGFDPEVLSPKSLGLRIMQERAEAVGATLKVDGRLGQGTKVRASWSERKRKVAK